MAVQCPGLGGTTCLGPSFLVTACQGTVNIQSIEAELLIPRPATIAPYTDVSCTTTACNCYFHPTRRPLSLVHVTGKVDSNTIVQKLEYAHWTLHGPATTTTTEPSSPKILSANGRGSTYRSNCLLDLHQCWLRVIPKTQHLSPTWYAAFPYTVQHFHHCR